MWNYDEINWNKKIQKNNENNFDTWISTHKPHHVFMENCGFESNENITILYKNYSCAAFKKHLII
jgi:hypothetical protein